ncbi:MAG: peptidylprolyl isomerase [bacterium]
MRFLHPLFCAVILAAGTICAGTADRIVAIVGSDAITESELEDAVSLLQAQLIDPPPAESLKGRVLDQLIENKLLLSQAKAETIRVTHDEVEEALNRSIEEIKSRFPTEEDFLGELEREHTSVAELKERYRDEIEDRLMVQKLVEKDLKKGIRVSETDLRRFYEAKKESIPAQPTTVRLAHILVAIKPGKGAEERASKLISRILSEIEQGVDFAILARRYSEDEATSDKGGDLGLIRRGDIPDHRFEQTLFSMIPAEVSVTTSPFGYHIIQCIDKKENTVRARHILIRALATRSDTAEARRLALSLMERARAGEDFVQLAREYSDDPQTKGNGGELGLFAVGDLSAPYDEVVSSMKPGDISEVVEGEFGYHIIKLLERVEGKPTTFENVKEELREIFYQRKLGEKYDAWLNRLKKGIYIEKRL